MRIIKRSARVRPRVSVILLDWSVRESFHLLHYLARQDLPRDAFEVIVIEYYSRVSEPVQRFEDQVDTWVALQMPEHCYYHKHLMYNAGVFLAQGQVCVICDSDAMVREGFLSAIIAEFDRDPGIVLHLDQFRNVRRDLYPFCYPTFEDVMGRGCVNHAGGTTAGLRARVDTIHTLNYGACMCARRDDLIAIGGADEHIDYLGHICGPYEMTFRLVNLGRREVWHPTEYLYHTWHPGQAGEDNYEGPHDGRQISTTALDALGSGRTWPLAENDSIRALRTGAASATDAFQISGAYATAWDRQALDGGRRGEHGAGVQQWRGFAVERAGEDYLGVALMARQPAFSALRGQFEVRAATVGQLRQRLSDSLGGPVRFALPGLVLLSWLLETLSLAVFLARTRWRRVLVAVES